MELDFENSAIMRFFREISSIPRPSGKEGAIAGYLAAFAEERGLEWYRDDIGNVVIKKPGSPGAENLAPVILQGHTDMVCEKNAGTEHDFDVEGIKLIREGDYLRADGTTLGADDGVAVAYMLAILDDNTLVHPPLECVFTVQEEIGLIGAKELDASVLSALTMINLDCGLFGTAVVSCAGGVRAELSRKFGRIRRDRAYAVKVSVRGLEGGHSGLDIIHGRANSIKILGRILGRILAEYGDMEISAISGGAKDNAIPRESDCLLLFSSESNRDGAAALVSSFGEEIKEELRETDPGFRVEIGFSDGLSQDSMGPDLTSDLVRLLMLAPDGVLRRSNAAGSFVVASVNLGVIESSPDEIRIAFLPRSSVASAMTDTKHALRALASSFGFDIEFDSEYPGWSFAEISPIRDVFAQSYRAMTGKDLKIEAVHAGLECGLFSEKLPGLDAISLGPNIFDCHTPQEKLDLETFHLLWDLVLDVLRKTAENKR